MREWSALCLNSFVLFDDWLHGLVLVRCSCLRSFFYILMIAQWPIFRNLKGFHSRLYITSVSMNIHVDRLIVVVSVRCLWWSWHTLPYTFCFFRLHFNPYIFLCVFVSIYFGFSFPNLLPNEFFYVFLSIWIRLVFLFEVLQALFSLLTLVVHFKKQFLLFGLEDEECRFIFFLSRMATTTVCSFCRWFFLLFFFLFADWWSAWHAMERVMLAKGRLRSCCFEMNRWLLFSSFTIHP